MNLFIDAIAWIFDPSKHTGQDDLVTRLLQHLGYTFGATLIGAVIALPLGYLIGHTHRGRDLAVFVSGGLRAIPSLGLLILFAFGVGIGFRAPLLTFVILAIPPLLAGAYSGVESVDARTVDAAKAVGMNPWQVLTRVEVPLGLPLLIGGIRASLLQVVATATLAAYVNGGALGVYIFHGVATRDYIQMLGASIVVTVLALVLEGAFAIIQKLVVPRGVSATRPSDIRSRPTRTRAVVGSPIEEGK
jgi:osmoprotectant transport system permease protein